MSISVVLADDHDIVRKGLRTLLETDPAFTIVGEAGDGLDVSEMVERLNPGVLVLDLSMPGLTGLEVARLVSRRSPSTRILMVSMHSGEGNVLEALRNGASGYALKDSPAQDLMTAIKTVASGQRYLSPSLSDRAIEAYAQRARATLPEDPYESLTTREREVLHLAAEGHTSADIADRLSISPRTAETHRSNMMHKLDLRSQTNLICYALRRGILTAETSGS